VRNSDSMTNSKSQRETKYRRARFWLVALGLLAVCVFARADWRISFGYDTLEDADDLQVNLAQGKLVRQSAFAVLAVAGAWGLIRPAARRLQVQWTALGAVAVALTVWCFASAIWSDNPSLASRRLFSLGTTIVASVALAKHFSSRDVMRLAFVCAGSHLLLDIAFAVAFGNFRPWEPGFRFSGLLHPNHEAANCALVILSSLALARGDRPGSRLISAKQGRVLYKAMAALAVVMIFLAKSRTAIAAMLLGYCCLRLQGAGRTARVVWVMGAVCVTCAAVLFLGDLIANGLSSGVTLDRPDSDVSTLTGRVPLWEELLGDFASEPLTGYGYGSFWTPQRIYFISDSQGWPVSHAHCDYLDIALALGLIGLALYVLTLALAIESLLTAHRENERAGHDGCAALFVFVAVGGIAEGVGLPFSLLQIIVMSAVARSSLIVAAPSDEFEAAEGDLSGKPPHTQSHWMSRLILSWRCTGSQS
jgi:exopolysaccharide production protein ExoQ